MDRLNCVLNVCEKFDRLVKFVVKLMFFMGMGVLVVSLWVLVR